ncbi:MAG TPA: hypothetical protein VN369_05415, partial [Terriglobales bacterium]|nr:hypothetical protein [Terriglobales bacterium]
AVPFPREVNSRSRAAFNCLIFEKDSKIRILTHFPGHSDWPGKSSYQKIAFLDNLKGPSERSRKGLKHFGFISKSPCRTSSSPS